MEGKTMKHELKIWPQYYCRVANGSKTFEVRKNDRGFQPGDEVALYEWDPNASNVNDSTSSGCYTPSKRLEFKIGYVMPIDAERVVFSLLPITEELKKAEG